MRVRPTYSIKTNIQTSGTDLDSIPLKFSPKISAYVFKDVWRRLRIKIRVITLLNKKIEFSKGNFDNPRANPNQAKFKFIWHPDSIFKKVWVLYMSVLMIYVAFVMPYSMAFIDSHGLDTWFCIDIFFDISFFCDIIVNMNSAYYAKDGVLVDSRKKIIINYAKSWLLIDIVSCIPFDAFNNSQSQSQSTNNDPSKSVLKFLRLPKLYRLLRIAKIFKMANNYRQTELIEKIQDFFRLKQSGVRLLTSCFTIMISVHITSCFWYYLAKIEGLSPETWVGVAGLTDADATTLYITSIYWAFTTFSTVGYGDITANTTPERILSILWMLFSVYYFSFVIGSLTSMLENVNTKSNMLMTKLAIIDEFAKEANLNKELLYKLRTALKYSNRKISLSIEDRDSILNELPKLLKHEMALAMHDQASSKIEFFTKLDNAIIAAVIPYLQPFYIDYGQYVYTKGEHAEGIYFITKGYVAYVIKKDETVIMGVQCGEHFGEIEVVLHITRKYSAKAIRNSDLLIMNRNVIQKFSEDYVDEWDDLRKKAKETDEKLIRTCAEIKESKIFADAPNFDHRKFKKNVEFRVLRKKNMTSMKSRLASIKKINIQTLYSKMENMSTKLLNLENNLKKTKNSFRTTYSRKNTLPVTRSKNNAQTEESILENY